MTKFVSFLKAWITIVVAGIIGAVVENYYVWHKNTLHIHVGALLLGLLAVVGIIVVAWLAIKTKHWLPIFLLFPAGVAVADIYHHHVLKDFSWSLLGVIVAVIAVSLVLAAVARGRNRSRVNNQSSRAGRYVRTKLHNAFNPNGGMGYASSSTP